MGRTFAQIAAEDKKMMHNIFRKYHHTPDEAKRKRELELVGDRFRMDGMAVNFVKNIGTCRERQAKR